MKTKQQLIEDAANALFVTAHGCQMPPSLLMEKATAFVEELIVNGAQYKPNDYNVFQMELTLTKSTVADLVAQLESTKLELNHAKKAREIDMLDFEKYKQASELTKAKLVLLCETVIKWLNQRHAGDFIKKLEELK